MTSVRTTRFASLVRKWTTRTLAATVLTAPVAFVGLSLAQSQPGQPVSAPNTPSPKASPGRSTSTLTRHSMKVAANGTSVTVYHADPVPPVRLDRMVGGGPGHCYGRAL